MKRYKYMLEDLRDKFIDVLRNLNNVVLRISAPLTDVLYHKLKIRLIRVCFLFMDKVYRDLGYMGREYVSYIQQLTFRMLL